MAKDLLRQLPQIDQWLSSTTGITLAGEFSRAETADVMRAFLGALRAELLNGADQLPAFDGPDVLQRLRADLLAQRTDSLRRTINATGIIIHTNLGRAPLADAALAAIAETARGYANLEFDLDTGKRGSRYQHVESLLTRLTGADAALVVNNCAAAVMLVLAEFARGAEVLVSRGELVEIGGSFRIPDVIAQSGAQMIEVGTTNKTRVADFERALTERTRIVLSTHPSNYRIVGFTARPRLGELAEFAHANGLLLVEDLGSGSLVPQRVGDAEPEPTVQASIAAGVDIVTFSGDKMLGGPQAGIVLGRAELIRKVRKNPLLRALRIDKLSLAALVATLRLYLPPNDPLESVPVLRMINADQSAIARRARHLLRRLREIPGINAELAEDVSYAGGGALPMDAIPTTVIRLRFAGSDVPALAARLRHTHPPVIGRISDDALLLDLRTVPDRETADLIAAIRQATG
jgi:L-seryl-tRNA(Ser) seleniumtransferase